MGSGLLNAGKQPPGRGRKSRAAMVRLIGLVCAALLFAGVAARADELCGASEQRQAVPGAAKNDKRPDQPPAGHEGGPKKWWIDQDLRNELAITDKQSADLEQVYQKTYQLRVDLRDRLDKADAILQKMILDGADEGSVRSQLDKVEFARSEFNKARVLLLYRMNKLLTQDQRAKLDAKAKAMRERDGRRGGPR